MTTRVSFRTLFEDIGRLTCRYSTNASRLSGQDIEIEGYLAPQHGAHQRYFLVDSPDECPDCAPAMIAAVLLMGLEGLPSTLAGSPRRLRVRGRLSYGFAVSRSGDSSTLRLEATDVSLAPAVDFSALASNAAQLSSAAPRF